MTQVVLHVLFVLLPPCIIGVVVPTVTQIVRQKAKDMYVLFTRWGRIGDRGQWQHTPFPTAQDAVKEFCKVFRQKTANDWNHLDK